MPGPVVHNIIAEQLPEAFARHGRHPETRQMSGILRNNRREMTYGSQGPDPFFFNPNDLLGKDVASKVLEWWNDIGHLANRMHEMFEPFRKIENGLKDELNKGANTLAANCDTCAEIKNLVVRIRALAKLVKTLITKFLKKFVVNEGDIFGLYVSPKQTCDTHHRDWWWFDTLHYRKTGDFTGELLDIGRGQAGGFDGGASRKDRLLSYGIGYLSHFAADVVGHAYVNTMVGGPYRHHAQRHTTMEKFMDVWAYDHYYDTTTSYGHSLKSLNSRNDRFYESSEVLNSGMHKNQQFTAGRHPPQEYESNPNELFQTSSRGGKPINWTLKLPEQISKNFAAAVNRTYDANQYGTFDPSEMDLSYRFWYLFFQMATDTGKVRHPSELPGGQPINKQIENEWDRFKKWAKNQFNDVDFGNGGGGNCQGVWSCLSSAAKSVWNFIKNLGKAIVNAVKVVVALGAWVVDNLLSLPVEFLNWAIQKLYEKAYGAYRNLLLAVGCTGFGYVYTDQVKNTPQIQNMLDPTAQDHFGNTVRDLVVKPGTNTSGYPRKRVRTGPKWNKKVQGVMKGLKNEAHLVVPFSDVESPRTVPGPDEYGLEQPPVFIENPSLNLDRSYIPRPPKDQRDTPTLEFGPPSNPNDFRPKSVSGGKGTYTKPLLGDAVRLTVQLFDEYVGADFAGRIPNLNMSGDRGIGYPTWANTNGSYEADSPRDDDEDLSRTKRRTNDSLRVEGCEWPSQQNWFRWTGTKNYKKYAWLKEPIEPVFEPDVSREERY